MEFDPNDVYIYLGFINGHHKVRNRRTGKVYNADKITTGGVSLSNVVKFLAKKIDAKPYKKDETPDNPGYDFKGKVIAISPYPVPKSVVDPTNLGRIGGHISNPLQTLIDNSSPRVSKTGANRNEWISGNQYGNFYWDKIDKEFKTYGFYPQGLENPINPNDKIPYELYWNGYGYWMGEWRKLDPITIVNTTTVSGLFTTTVKSESCNVEVIAINLNSKVRYPGTYSQTLTVVQQKPGDPSYDPNNPDPYVSPPPACEPVCVPDGPLETDIGVWTVPYPIVAATGRANRPILIPPYTENPTREQIRAAYVAKYSGLGPVSSGDSFSSTTPGGSTVFIVRYTAKSEWQPLRCTCQPEPTPPPPTPPNEPTPTPPPDPPGLIRTENYSLLLEILNIAMKPGLLRPIRWEETRNVSFTDGVQTSKTQSRNIDCWFPLVRNEKGDAVIAMQIYQVSSLSNPPPPEVRFWYSPPGSTSLTALNRAIFEPILLKEIVTEVNGVSVSVGIDVTLEARFNIQERQQPTPDLFTPPGKPAFLARVKYPDPDDPEFKQPDTKDLIMDIEFWELPSGTKTTKKQKVKSLKIVEDGAIPHYSYHSGIPSDSG